MTTNGLTIEGFPHLPLSALGDRAILERILMGLRSGGFTVEADRVVLQTSRMLPTARQSGGISPARDNCQHERSADQTDEAEQVRAGGRLADELVGRKTSELGGNGCRRLTHLFCGASTAADAA